VLNTNYDYYIHLASVSHKIRPRQQLGTKNAMQGYGEAQLALGKIYLSGSSVPQDNELAHYWLSKAVPQGKRDTLLQ
jgi:TPR repeat protein